MLHLPPQHNFPLVTQSEGSSVEHKLSWGQHLLGNGAFFQQTDLEHQTKLSYNETFGLIRDSEGFIFQIGPKLTANLDISSSSIGIS